ncbi:MAG: helix-turn-helix transcriptional regulator [Actinomycetia bacterium]|nr:helix-turn-helix transcriptional regulator [Actinomycetes bacterium]
MTMGLDRALEQVGDRWSLAIIEAVLAGHHRFGELESAIPGLAANILSQRLRHLEAAGVLTARPYQRRPPRFAYEATDRGRSLGPAIDALAAWGTGEGRPEPDEGVVWI